MPDMDALRAWVSYDDDKKDASSREKRAKSKCAELEDQIMESFIADGVSSVQVTLDALDVDKEARETAEAAVAEFERTAMQNIGDLHDAWNVADIAAAVVDALRSESLLRDNRPEITKTVFIGSRVWAKPVPTGTDDNGDPKSTDDDYLRACEALKTAGWGDYVQTRFNIISLSSAVKEEVDAGNIVIPEGERETLAFDGTIIVSDAPQLNARKVTKKKGSRA